MKKLAILLIVAISIIGNSTKIKAQNAFPSDSIEFFNAMESYLTNARKEGKDFMKQFETVWYGGYFTEEQRKGVYSISNLMLQKKMRAFPDFRNYLYTVGSFVTSDFQTEKSFDLWQSTLQKLLNDRNKRKFSDYLTFSNGLFSENAMYISASTKWSANNNNYVFGYDSLPKITFEALDLICFAKDDSMKIKNTKGVYYPTEDLWIGQGGVVDWQKAGLLDDEVYAEIRNYKIITKTYSYSADSVLFYNSFYFDKPLLGRLEDKIQANNNQDKSTYPRFDSYDKRIEITNISPAVNYKGGFSMNGSKFYGSGDEKLDAILEFIREDTLFLRASSKVFIITPDKIVSDNAAISFYLKQDSIYHPGLNFKFMMKDKQISLYRDNQGLAISPYFDSFHKIDMDFELLSWNQEEPQLKMSRLVGSTRTEASFTSDNFFKMSEYQYLQGRGERNPLLEIQKLSDREDSRDLTIEQLSYFMRISDADAKNMAMFLATRGFLKYNFKKGTFYVKKRLTQYVQSSFGKIDYDVISINSEIDGKDNATLNLLNYDLTINGVEGILLSDSQKVYIIPSDQRIVMKKDRFFTFGGQVKAVDIFSFYGKEFSFDYQQFKINLTNVDSLKLRAFSDEVDRFGNPILKDVRSVLEGMSAELLIDNFENKSGLKEFPEYPIINSFNDSYVYYDKKEVEGGVYKRDNFYFRVNPFKIDSLDNFTNDRLKFDGSFTSNIFPEFDQSLTVQKDMSLGFITNTPPGGYPAYGGKGQFTNEVRLSNKGLRGGGTLEYLTSTTIGDDFRFYPESVEGLAKSHVLAEVKTGTEFPPMKGDSVNIKWEPQKDVFYTTAKGDKFLAMYDMQSKFVGTSALRPDGLTANGLYKFKDANLTSKLFKFKNTVFDADTAAFELIEQNTEVNQSGFALNTSNVKAHVDYEGRFAEFKPNGDNDPIFFPVNQYLCFMEEFKWYMDSGIIDFTGESQTEVSADVKLEGSKFVSTHPGQDSLFFYSPLARFDSRKHIISAFDVQYINAADAKIIPDSGLVVINKAANMQALENAGIIANAVTEYHNIYNANVKIEGRKKYFGSGYIDYVDESDNKIPIYLQEIKVDTTGQTTAHGVIEDDPLFTLSSQYAFTGEVDLYANNEFLIFDGGVRINHDCSDIGKSWLRFRAEIDPNEIYIPIDTGIVDINKTILSASINLNTDTMFIYSAFLSQKVFHSDRELIPAYGFLYFNKAKNQYEISTKEKLKAMDRPGNYLSLNLNDCKVYGEGRVSLGADMGQVKMTTIGSLVHNQVDNDVVGDFMMALDFHFDDNSLKKMADHINENINLQAVDLSREFFEKGLREIIPIDEADKLISQLSLNGKFKRIPNELNQRIVFNDIKFKWDEQENTFVSFGGLGISNIGKEEVNKYIGGVVMITKKRGGDILDIYLEIDENNWYYFNYRRGLMQVVSSNDDFNNQVKSIKDDNRKADVARKEEPFTYMYGNVRKKDMFLRQLGR